MPNRRCSRSANRSRDRSRASSPCAPWASTSARKWSANSSARFSSCGAAMTSRRGPGTEGMSLRVAPDSDEARQILEAIDRWLARDVAPHVMKLEHDDVWPAQMVAQMQALGLFGATIDPQYGGLGLSAQLYARIVSRISEVWMSLTGIFNSHLMMALLVEKFGGERLRGKYLRKFASGELRGGLALTEPDAGTDLQAIRMRARREGEHYVLNGTKTWISNGIHGSCFAVLAKTDPQAEPRHRGMTLFLCEKGPGFAAGRKLEKLGYKGIDSAELVFDNFRVSAE